MKPHLLLLFLVVVFILFNEQTMLPYSALFLYTLTFYLKNGATIICASVLPNADPWRLGGFR